MCQCCSANDKEHKDTIGANLVDTRSIINDVIYARFTRHYMSCPDIKNFTSFSVNHADIFYFPFFFCFYTINFCNSHIETLDSLRGLVFVQQEVTEKIKTVPVKKAYCRNHIRMWDEDTNK